MSIKELLDDPNFNWKPFNHEDMICPISREKIQWPILVNNYLVDLQALYNIIVNWSENSEVSVPIIGTISKVTINYVKREYELLQKNGAFNDSTVPDDSTQPE